MLLWNCRLGPNQSCDGFFGFASKPFSSSDLQMQLATLLFEGMRKPVWIWGLLPCISSL
jgi:hypothetical protein